MKGVVRLLVPAAVVAVVIAGAVSAANPAGNGRIVLLENGDLFSVEPDGSDRRQLSVGGRISSPVVSPDGSRIAFLKSDGSSPRDLYVMNADASGGDRLLASHPDVTNAGGILGITWSPDSALIAYFLTTPRRPIRVVDARDGSPVSLPQEETDDPRGPRPFGGLQWSPDGSELVYDDGGDIWIKPLDGRRARQVVGVEGQDTRPTWSPDGTRIAFIHAGTEAAGGVYVVRRDGTELRHVAATGTAIVGTLRWKPDATAVVFDATVVEAGAGRFPRSTSRILFAGAEGSVLGVLRDHTAGPIPSPDNGQVLVQQAARVTSDGYESPKPGVYVMNADGSCLTLVTTGLGVDWQRAPPVAINPPRACVDLVVSATAPAVTGLRGVPYSVVVRNEGTLRATNVRLRLSVHGDVSYLIGRSTSNWCAPTGASVLCTIDRLEPRQTFSGAILARPRTTGPVVAVATTSSSTRDADPASDEAELTTRVRGCWIAGSDFSDRLRGTRAGEEICGYAGSDAIEGRGGNDRLDGGWHSDTLDGGPGRDRLVGGRGDDTILARDGERDTVDCGWGDDRAVADRIDRVLRGCERVQRH